MGQQMYTTMRVIEASGDTRTMSMVTDSVRGGMFAAGEMDGIEQRMTMDTRGRIISMDLAEDNVSPEAQRALEDMQNGLRGLGWELPEEPVSPGGTWDATATIEMPGGGGAAAMMSSGLLLNTTYTLQRFEGPHAIIAMSGTMKMGEGDATGGIELSGEITGDLVLDIEVGQLVNQNLTMEMTLGMGGQTMGNMTMEFANQLVR